MNTVLEITSVLRSVFGVVGGVVCVYFAIRVVVTIFDVLNRWRTGNWDVDEQSN